jgi:seryl-tRNA synthetase
MNILFSKQIQQDLFAPLGIHYKVLDMPACDLGPSAARKFDVEAWMPARRIFGEISSCSSCTDYQARRLGISCDGDEVEPVVVETANGTACAVPRVMIALVETHQQKDGSVAVPDVLVPYMGGERVIRRPQHRFKHVWIKSLSGEKAVVDDKRKHERGADAAG